MSQLQININADRLIETAESFISAMNRLSTALESLQLGEINNGTPFKDTVHIVPLSQTAPATPAVPVAPAQPAAPAVPTAAPQYTLEMIATAGSALIDAGKLDQLMALLGKFGVDSLTNLAPENYGAIAQELRALGARI